MSCNVQRAALNYSGEVVEPPGVGGRPCNEGVGEAEMSPGLGEPVVRERCEEGRAPAVGGGVYA